jgi:hypothetical protein
MTSHNDELRAYMHNVWLVTSRWLRRAGHVVKAKGTRVRTQILWNWKRPLLRFRRIWADNIKIDISETGRDRTDIGSWLIFSISGVLPSRSAATAFLSYCSWHLILRDAVNPVLNFLTEIVQSGKDIISMTCTYCIEKKSYVVKPQ